MKNRQARRDGTERRAKRGKFKGVVGERKRGRDQRKIREREDRKTETY